MLLPSLHAVPLHHDDCVWCSLSTEEELDDAFARASNEAKASFGDGRMFAEKCAKQPAITDVPSEVSLCGA